MITVRLKFRCPWCLVYVEDEVELDPALRMIVNIDEHRACKTCREQFTGKKRQNE